MNRGEELDAMLERQKIYDVLVRYCRGVDRGDRELLDRLAESLPLSSEILASMRSALVDAERAARRRPNAGRS